MKSNNEIVKDFYGEGGRKSRSERGLSRQKEEDELNRGYYDGDETAYKAELSSSSTKFMVCLNRVQPLVNAFAGFAAQNRRQPEYIALEKEDEKRQVYTEIANKMLRWVRSNGNADQVETQQDLQMAICGYGAVMPAIDYTRNPDGEVVFKEVTRDFYWDAQAKEAGLMDRRWEFVKTTMYVEDALAFFGGKQEDYEAANTTNIGAFRYDPNLGGNYDRIAYDWVGKHDPSLINVYEYHWYDLEKYWRIENPIYDEENAAVAPYILADMERLKALRLEEMEDETYYNFDPRSPAIIADNDLKADIEEICNSYGIEIDADENLRKVYYEAVLSGSKVFQKRRAIDQSGFACKIKTASFDKKNKLWRGMVSSLREPAKYANKAVTEFLYILAATAKPGWFYDQNKILDISAFEDRVNKSAKAIPVDGDPSTVVMPKQQSVLPNGYDTLYPLFLQALTDVVEFAPEAMGLGDLSQPSFELEQQRIKQVMVTLAVYFDAITLYQKEHARSMPYFMRRLAKNKEGRPIVAENADGIPDVSEVYSNMLLENYAIEIGEAPDSPTKKKEQAAAVTVFADKVVLSAPQMATKALAMAARYLPISGRERMEWVNLLDPQVDPQAAAEQAQKQQMQEQIAIEQNAAQIEKVRAEAALKAAQTDKTKAEISKVEAEADKANLEALTMSSVPVTSLNVNI